MKFFDLQHPFYKPLWIRIAIVAVCLGMTALELSGGNVFWAILFGSVGVYAFHQFFIAFNPRDPEDGSKP
jgi:hypothetical protein